MKRFVFILLASFLLADGRKLSNWANDKDNFTPDLDEIGSRQVCVISFLGFAVVILV